MRKWINFSKTRLNALAGNWSVSAMQFSSEIAIFKKGSMLSQKKGFMVSWGTLHILFSPRSIYCASFFSINPFEYPEYCPGGEILTAIKTRMGQTGESNSTRGIQGVMLTCQNNTNILKRDEQDLGTWSEAPITCHEGWDASQTANSSVCDMILWSLLH